MKRAIFLIFLILFLMGCSRIQEKNTPSIINGTQDLILNDKDLQQVGIVKDFNSQDLEQLGITGNLTNCRTDNEYTNIIDSSQGQYSICAYSIESLNDTQVIVELQKFANQEALNGSYLYSSSHLYSIEGLISQNDYGDQSTFRVNNEHDYGGQYNDPNMYYYHLWFTKDLYLVHITSSGKEKVEDSISNIGKAILSKFN